MILPHTFTKVLKVVSVQLPGRLCLLAAVALPHCVEGISCKFVLLLRFVKMQQEKDPEQLTRNWALLMTQLREDPRVRCQEF